MYLTLQAAITDKLRNCGIAGIQWGSQASPFYEVADAPVPIDKLHNSKNPTYVQFEVADSEVEGNFVNLNGTNTGNSYVEWYELTVRVVASQALIETLSSPYAATSVINYLDGYIPVPQLLDGAFTCEWFTRKSWSMHKSDQRAPSGELVWEAVARYKVGLEFPYPNARTS